MKKSWFKFGPASLITAAFIGPGTVTVCSIAGASAGFTLLWGMMFSIFASIILQELVARISIASHSTLEQNLMKLTGNRRSQLFIGILMLLLILFGNTAYQTGNILGANMGMELLFSSLISMHNSQWNLIIIFFLTAFILWKGDIILIKNIMVALVAVMSFAFVIAAFLSQPDLLLVLKGMFIPSVPEGNSIVLVSLIGTTIVPYNLFLYSYLVNNNYPNRSFSYIRQDLVSSIWIGGIISFSIIIVAAGMKGAPLNNSADLAQLLVSTYGDGGYVLIGMGLFAAGISSSITAPLAVSMIAVNIFHWEDGLKNIRARLLWLFVLFLGFLFAYTSYKPIEVIKVAQFLNGLLLPAMAILLLYLVNNRAIMKTYRNVWYHNLLSVIVILVCTILGIKSMFSVLNLL